MILPVPPGVPSTEIDASLCGWVISPLKQWEGRFVIVKEALEGLCTDGYYEAGLSLYAGKVRLEYNGGTCPSAPAELPSSL